MEFRSKIFGIFFNNSKDMTSDAHQRAQPPPSGNLQNPQPHISGFPMWTIFRNQPEKPSPTHPPDETCACNRCVQQNITGLPTNHCELMRRHLFLASGSQIRFSLLRDAGLDVTSHPVKVDEATIRDAMTAEGASPRDMADALAELKAAKLAVKQPDGLILGCDQVLDFKGTCLNKAESRDEAKDHLIQLRGQKHLLHSALVVFDQGRPVWRFVGTARLTMRDFSDEYLDGYLNRNWPSVAQSVGSYMIETEGIRLFSAIDGDYHTILGLPLLPLLSWLALRGFIAS